MKLFLIATKSGLVFNGFFLKIKTLKSKYKTLHATRTVGMQSKKVFLIIERFDYV